MMMCWYDGDLRIATCEEAKAWGVRSFNAYNIPTPIPGTKEVDFELERVGENDRPSEVASTSRDG